MAVDVAMVVEEGREICERVETGGETGEVGCCSGGGKR